MLLLIRDIYFALIYIKNINVSFRVSFEQLNHENKQSIYLFI